MTIDRRSVRRDGKRIPFLGLPTKCDGKWIVTATNELYEGDPHDGEAQGALHRGIAPTRQN